LPTHHHPPPSLDTRDGGGMSPSTNPMPLPGISSETEGAFVSFDPPASPSLARITRQTFQPATIPSLARIARRRGRCPSSPPSPRWRRLSPSNNPPPLLRLKHEMEGAVCFQPSVIPLPRSKCETEGPFASSHPRSSSLARNVRWRGSSASSHPQSPPLFFKQDGGGSLPSNHP